MGLMITLLAALVVGFLSSLIAAGPISFLVFQNAVSGQYRKSIALLLGAATMETIYCGIAVFSLGLLVQQSTRIVLLSKALGAAISLLVGLYLLLHTYKPSSPITVEIISHTALVRAYFMGVVLVLCNPGIILTWSVAIALLLSFEAMALPTLFSLFVFMLAAGLGITLGSFTMASFAHFYKGKFTGRIVGKTIKTMGILLILLGLYLVYNLAIILLNPS